MVARYSTDWDLVGHRWAVEHLAGVLMYDRLRHAYLISGPPRVGKTTFARAFARTITCTSELIRPCGECRSCRLNIKQVHPDVQLIQGEPNASGTMRLKIDHLRPVIQAISLRPVESKFKVILLDELQNSTPEAQDAFLKTLEEPPSYAVLLLTVDKAENLLMTIRSRCQPVLLRTIPSPLIRAELEKRGADPDQAALLAQLSGGRIAWAIHALANPESLETRQKAIKMLEDVIKMDRVARFQYAVKLTEQRTEVTDWLNYWSSYWRDVILILSGTQIGVVNRDRQEALDQLASGLHLEEVHQALKAIERTQSLIDKNVNLRLALEGLMLELPRFGLLVKPMAG
jgi:DNA polymerase-3 subunit delta'